MLDLPIPSPKPPFGENTEKVLLQDTGMTVDEIAEALLSDPKIRSQYGIADKDGKLPQEKIIKPAVPKSAPTTRQSMLINDRGKDVLIPTVTADGRPLSSEEAIDLYIQTGQTVKVPQTVPDINLPTSPRPPVPPALNAVINRLKKNKMSKGGKVKNNKGWSIYDLLTSANQTMQGMMDTLTVDAPQKINRDDLEKLELASDDEQNFYKEMGVPQHQDTTFAYRDPETGEMQIYKRGTPTTTRSKVDDLKATADSLGRVLSFNMVNPVVGTGIAAARGLGAIEGGTMGTFGGAKSRLANLDKLKLAQRLEEIEGATPGVIWDETKWFKGRDGKWRYEISDRPMKVNFNLLQQIDRDSGTLTQTPRIPISEVIDHPELFESYPKTRNATIGLDRTLRHDEAMVYPDTKELFFAPSNVLSDGSYVSVRGRKPIVHELQHLIQDQEGFLGGGGPEDFLPATRPTPGEYERAMHLYLNMPGEAEARNVERRLIYPDMSELHPGLTETIDPYLQQVVWDPRVKRAKGGLIPSMPKTKASVKFVNPIKKQHYRQTLNVGPLTKMRTSVRRPFK